MATGSHHGSAPAQKMRGNEWRALGLLAPYVLEFKWRVAAALACLIAAKLANVGVPLVMKEVVDGLDPRLQAVALPVALLAIYGALRFSATLFAELRDVVFVRVTQRAIRRVALGVFRHLHSLSLRFHLDRQTGGMTRDIERGTRGISTLLSYLLFSIIPVILEFALVAAVLISRFDWRFAAITFGAVAVYIGFTVTITEWRMEIRRRANELDSRANTRAIDSLLNYETVKYFGNEDFEARRYDEQLLKYEAAATKNEASLGLLNIGQSLIIAIAVTALMVLAAEGVATGSLTLGDLVLVNGLLIQLYIPLNFLGMVYREIKQSLLDMDRMFRLLGENREVEDQPGAPELPEGPATVDFMNVNFAYEKDRQILFEVSFSIPAGHRVAVVGTRAPENRPSPGCFIVFMMLMFQAVRFPSTEKTFATQSREASGRRSASCRRTRCSSTTRSSTTSATAGRTRATRKCSRLREPRISTISSSLFRKNMKPWSASAA
jgi:ATP-binding cassette subfamily B protein